MKAKISALIIVLMITGSYCVYAQKDSSKTELPKPSGYIGVCLGVSFPVGKFADPNVGGAGFGPTGGYNFGLPLFHSNFGIAAKFDYTILDQTGISFLNQQKKIGDQWTGSNVVEYSIDSISEYRQFNFMGGLYYTKPFLKRFSVDGRVLIGYNHTVKDELAVKATILSTNQVDYLIQGGAVSDAFCYDAGISFRINLGKRQHIGLALNVDYVGAQGVFNIQNDALYQANGQTYEGKYKETLKYSVSAVNTSLGVSYIFGQRKKKM